MVGRELSEWLVEIAASARQLRYEARDLCTHAAVACERAHTLVGESRARREICEASRRMDRRWARHLH